VARKPSSVHPAAEREATREFRYYQRVAAMGNAFLDALAAALERASKAPEAGSPQVWFEERPSDPYGCAGSRIDWSTWRGRPWSGCSPSPTRVVVLTTGVVEADASGRNDPVHDEVVHLRGRESQRRSGT